MSGCTNCGEKVGCDDRKGSMFARVDELLAQVFPKRSWDHPDDHALDALAFELDLDALASELAHELTAEVRVVPGDDDDRADYLYVLCHGRPPTALAVRAGAPWPDDWHPGTTLTEAYLRIAVSRLAPLAGVQEVVLEVQVDDTGVCIDERPRAGVYSAPLLSRMQRLVAILPAYDLLHLDFGELTQAPPGFTADGWHARFPGLPAPALANYFLGAQPLSMDVSTYLPRAPAC